MCAEDWVNYRLAFQHCTKINACHCEEALRADVAISSETEAKWIDYAKQICVNNYIVDTLCDLSTGDCHVGDLPLLAMTCVYFGAVLES